MVQWIRTTPGKHYQDSRGSKPTHIILLCLCERNCTTLYSVLQSQPAASSLGYTKKILIKTNKIFQLDSNILTFPNAFKVFCLAVFLSIITPLKFFLRVRKINKDKIK